MSLCVSSYKVSGYLHGGAAVSGGHEGGTDQTGDLSHINIRIWEEIGEEDGGWWSWVLQSPQGSLQSGHDGGSVD